MAAPTATVSGCRPSEPGRGCLKGLAALRSPPKLLQGVLELAAEPCERGAALCSPPSCAPSPLRAGSAGCRVSAAAGAST
eukprot:11172051-Lingulodinium_polyedra.AAC.1